MPTIRIANKNIIISDKIAHLFSEWANLAEKYFGRPRIPVGVVSRYQVNQLKQFKGELNTAQPMRVHGRWTLIVTVEYIDPLNEIMVAHEIMHWIIKFYGFRTIQNKSNPNDDCTILLNSLTSHVPLNRFMAERNFDYFPMENARAEDAAKLIHRDNLPKSPIEEKIIREALYYSDLILSSSSKSGAQLRLALKTCSSIDTRVGEILSALEHYDLHKPDENQRAKRWLIKILRLNKWGYFIDFDDLSEMRQMLKESPN